MRIDIALAITAIWASGYLPAAGPEDPNDGLSVAASDWPWWRGPSRNGTANADQSPPIEFGEDSNLAWRADIPGRGHGSPTVVGNQIFLVSCLEEPGAQVLLCFDRGDGELMWQAVVHSKGAMWKNSKASAASCTPACDGSRVVVTFPNGGALYASAFDLVGKPQWQTKISDYVVHQGYGASPALYRNLVIVTSDNKGGGAVAALERATGEIVWRRERPKKPNYSSPVLVNSAGKTQLILTGCDQVVSLDPLTGKTNWETAGATTECVTSTVTDGNLIYTSGGYPKNHMSAVRADGSSELVWENSSRLYVPSLVIRDGNLFGVLDEGIAMCWRADSGKEVWKARLGGTFSSSPVIVGKHIYVSNEAGDFFVFKAEADRFERIAKNSVGNEVFATPAICDSRIYHRVANLSDSGERQEVLYCFAKSPE